MPWLSDPNAWVALVSLTVLEIVLGIDNIVFISVLAGRLPRRQQARARQLGLAVALVTRIGLLLTISWVVGLTQPLIRLLEIEFSGRDLILIGGGVFLLTKATTEIHHALEGTASEGRAAPATSFASVIVQIALLDVVFSLDSVVTAVGMADDIAVMIAAIVVAIAVMLVASAPLAKFVDQHPTVKVLALSFLLLIGMSLVAEGFEVHIPKGYLYFAMGFSVFVELVNLRVRARTSSPLRLRPRPPSDGPREAI